MPVFIQSLFFVIIWVVRGNPASFPKSAFVANDRIRGLTPPLALLPNFELDVGAKAAFVADGIQTFWKAFFFTLPGWHLEEDLTCRQVGTYIPFLHLY